MSDSDALKAIKREFGMRGNVIERAFKSSESFRAVCRDYQDCARALSRWRKSASEEARLREAEYSELLLELTAEIEARLQAVGNIADSRSDA